MPVFVVENFELVREMGTETIEWAKLGFVFLIKDFETWMKSQKVD